MCERYSELVGSVRNHSDCTALNDTNEHSIFLSFYISRASDTFVSAPNCAVHREVRISKEE
jgi:hypothetical protein